MWFKNLKIKSKIFAGFSVVLILMLSVSIGVYLSTTSMIDTFKWVDHTNKVIAEANNLVKLLVDQETGARGFLITGKDEFLAPYNNGITDFERSIEELKNTVSDNPAQVERLNSLSDEHATWKKDIIDPMIQLRRDVISGTYSLEMLIEEEQKARGKQGMDRMRGIVAEFIGIESKLNDERKADAESSSEFLIWFTFFASGIAIFLGIFISFYIAKKISVPVNDLVRISEKLALGDINVDLKNDSTDEIGQLSSSFTRMIQTQKDKVKAAEEIASGTIKQVALASGNDAIGIAFNKEVEVISGLLNDTRVLLTAAKEGKLDTRGNAEKYAGIWAELIMGINSILDEVLKPIKEGSEVLKIMTTGDLTAKVKGEYKGDHQIIKNSINMVSESLNTALSQVNEAVAATASAAAQISSSSEEMAAGTQEQSAQTSEIAGAVEEMTKTIIETSQNASIAAESSVKASQNAKKGAEKINETKKGMMKIVDSVKVTGSIISSLAVKTDQIGVITQVIDEIADQTNLLALNAAIEAARAGEQGRGFAVVADEVRKLAERTTKATKEIADTIKSVQMEAKEADNSMIEAGESVKHGMALTEEVANVLHEILEVNSKVSDMVNQVAAASEQQSTTAEEISKNIESISSVTHQSASSTQQIAKAAEDLNQLANRLQDLVEQFKLENNMLQVKNSNMKYLKR